ncbi:ECF transporter S component [Neomicrococcus lactis]
MSTSLSSPANKVSLAWRPTDIVVAAVLAVACGIIFWAWNSSYQVLAPLWAAFPPASSLINGMWLFPAVLGGLIIRKPGAALFVELVAAVISAFLGSSFGMTVLASGLVQGLGAELVFAFFLYRKFHVIVAILAGLATGLFGGVNDAYIFNWFPEYSETWKLVYVLGSMVSGAIAGVVAWLVTRALAKTGALSSLRSRNAAVEPATR